VDALASRYETGAPAQPVTWLSGEFVTFVNKIGPVLWLASVTAGLTGIYLATGGISIDATFRPLIAVFLLATVFICWLSVRIQRVGYSGRELIIANYSRRERIPFDQVEAVQPVWWYYRRMVRIRLRTRSSFGDVVYYIPKWAAIRCLWVAPEKELQELLDSNPTL
jgi:hypothetical protein